MGRYQNPNQSWKTSPSFAVEPDGWELSTWGQYWNQEFDAGISPFLDNGFRAQFGPSWTEYVYSTEGYPWVLEGDEVWERDLRDTAFKPYGPAYGTANTGFDRADFNLWMSHGATNMLDVNDIDGVFHDNDYFEQQYARWGKYDAEWDYIIACSFTGWTGGQWTYDYGTMAGLHSLCGFANTMTCPADNPDDIENGDDYLYGRDLVRYLTGQKDTVNHTIVEAFELQAKDFHDGSEIVRCFFTPTTLFDHLPDYGSFAIVDPVGWMVGGPAYYRDSET